MLTGTTEILKGKSSPQLGIAACVHQLWIHEIGLCIGAGQYHQANLQNRKQQVCEDSRAWDCERPRKGEAVNEHFGVPAVFPIRFSNPSAFPMATAVFETHIHRETLSTLRSCQKHNTHIRLSLRVTQMWSSSADFSSCLVLMAFTAKTSFFL